MASLDIALIGGTFVFGHDFQRKEGLDVVQRIPEKRILLVGLLIIGTGNSLGVARDLGSKEEDPGPILVEIPCGKSPVSGAVGKKTRPGLPGFLEGRALPDSAEKIVGIGSCAFVLGVDEFGDGAFIGDDVALKKPLGIDKGDGIEVIVAAELLEDAVCLFVISRIDEEVELLIVEDSLQGHRPFRIVAVDKVAEDMDIGIAVPGLQGRGEGLLDVHIDRTELVERLLSLIDGGKIGLERLKLAAYGIELVVEKRLEADSLALHGIHVIAEGTKAVKVKIVVIDSLKDGLGLAGDVLAKFEEGIERFLDTFAEPFGIEVLVVSRIFLTDAIIGLAVFFDGGDDIRHLHLDSRNLA